MSKAIGSEIESKPAKVYDLGLTGLPVAQRPGIVIPTPKNLQRVADDAAAKRERESNASAHTPQSLGRSWGVSVELAQLIQRLEATIIEQGRRIAHLEAAETSALPRHLRDIERRG